MASGADRARASRIRSKGSNATAEETAWLDDFERKRAKAPFIATHPAPAPVKVEETPPKEIVSEELPPVAPPPIDQPSFDSDEEVEPDRVIFYDDKTPETSIEKVAEAGSVTGFVASSTATTTFLLMKTGWSIFGDRVHVEPDEEEMTLMTKVINSYAERYGWTREMDDALLLGTVLLAYNARCHRAPKKGEQK